MKRNRTATALVFSFLVAHLAAKGVQRARGEARAGWLAASRAPWQQEHSLDANALAAMEVEEAASSAVALSAVISRSPLTIVAFFEPWCGSCRVEMPELERVRVDFEAQGLAVVGVHTDGEDEAIAALKAKLGLHFPLLRDAHGVGRTAGIDAIPTLVVFDRDAHVLRHRRGADAQLRPFVAQYLARPVERPRG